MELLARAKVEVASREEAIGQVGSLLIDNNYITQDYVTECLDVLQTYGAYFVIAPGIAFVHSKPSAGVLKTGMSLVTLQTPVLFGSLDNDPVDIVFMIASQDGRKHLQTLVALSRFLGQKENVEQLRTVDSDRALNEMLQLFL